jgi:hypothetical protein
MFAQTVTASDNIMFTLAEEFITHTSRPIFLTGKAGTGKTTFLRHIKNTTAKNTAVVAPTGVAAIHCGGTTIHSFFQLPFTPFVPEVQRGTEKSANLSDKYSLLKNLKIDSEKRTLFRELELLIIDEVSMVRCDILDAIDTVLRYFRKKPSTPFGGVQVLFIGDLFQLPPVVPDDQWKILQEYYEGPFFFQAKVMQQSRPLYIELKKIYRQTDRHFIDVLNRIRNNEVEEEDLQVLNACYQPEFRAPAGENYITLTTHNHKADAINSNELARLPGELHRFEGGVEGDFPERNFPTDRVLNLKKGAQVMFIKNDTEKIRRYYNGKIGTVKEIREDKIIVVFPDEDRELEVEKDTWKNIRYTFDAKTRRVEEEMFGTFTQYAIRLAWAITIHKSQGLTFERAIIDAGNSFAAGQVYVALSRCTSLSGVILYSRIFRNSVMTDERVIRFAKEEVSADALQPILQEERQQHILHSLLDIFDWTKTIDELTMFLETLQERKFADKKKAEDCIQKLLVEANVQQPVALKFQAQLKRLFTEACEKNDFAPVQARVEAAIQYFTGKADDEFLALLKEHQKSMKGKARVKGYLKELGILIGSFDALKAQFQRASKLLEVFCILP